MMLWFAPDVTHSCGETRGSSAFDLGRPPSMRCCVADSSACATVQDAEMPQRRGDPSARRRRLGLLASRRLQLPKPGGDFP